MSQNKTPKIKTPKIDFVITWVDGSDEEWLAKKRTFAENQPPIENQLSIERPRFDSSDLRFRNDFDFLKYWFRGVEKFAPWVNQIFFVTAGHLPDWLNLQHPKFKIIRHSDFIPQEFLPQTPDRKAPIPRGNKCLRRCPDADTTVGE